MAYPSLEFVPEEGVEVVLVFVSGAAGWVVVVVARAGVVDALHRHDETRTAAPLPLVAVRVAEALVVADEVRRVRHLHHNLQCTRAQVKHSDNEHQPTRDLATRYFAAAVAVHCRDGVTSLNILTGDGGRVTRKREG